MATRTKSKSDDSSERKHVRQAPRAPHLSPFEEGSPEYVAESVEVPELARRCQARGILGSPALLISKALGSVSQRSLCCRRMFSRNNCLSLRCSPSHRCQSNAM